MGKHILILVADGVNHPSYQQLRHAFESERAQLYVTSPSVYLSVESIEEGRRGPDILVDLPLDLAEELVFDALLVPDGQLALATLSRDTKVKQLLSRLRRFGVPVFAAGEAEQLLASSPSSLNFQLVAEGESASRFVDQAVGLLLEHAPGYRTSPRI